MSRRDLISTFDYAIDKEKISVGNRNVNAASVFDEVARILPAGNDTPKALIFFTDQQSTDIANLAANVMKKKLEDEQLVEIFSVAVGTNSKDEPAALASTPDNVFSVSEYSSLPRISEEFVQRLGICKFSIYLREYFVRVILCFSFQRLRRENTFDAFECLVCSL